MAMRDGEHTSGNTRRRVSIDVRKSKVGIQDFASLPDDFAWFSDLEKMLPSILAGGDIKELASRVVGAVKEGRPVILMMGAHVIKCGLGTLIAELIHRGVITSLAMNGACAIHDVELAIWGRTSEDVGEGLKSGEFGMTEETAGFFARAAGRCLEHEIGMGAGLLQELDDADPVHREVSVLAACSDRGIIPTVHIAIGTDVVHQHAEADGKAIGFATMKDFRLFSDSVANLKGGVVLNFGSAVIMPEVFLKALAVSRSRNADLGDFTTANFDMYSLYRPRVNLVERPKLIGAKTYNFLGHHELLIPVLVASILCRIA
jgi:hypothetical protein